MSKTSSSSSSDSSSSSTSVGSVVSEGKDTTVSKSWRLQELEKKVGSLDSHATFQFQKNAIHKVLHIEDGVTTTVGTFLCIKFFFSDFSSFRYLFSRFCVEQRDFLAKRDFGQDFPLWQKYIDGCANEEV